MTNSLLLRLYAERERWIVWVPVLLASGIGLYYALPNEPPGYHLFVVGSLVPILAWMLRRNSRLLIPTLTLFLIAAGFAVAKYHTDQQDVVMLEREVKISTLSGRIVEVNAIPNGLRLTMDVMTIEPWRQQSALPSRVRLNVKGNNPKVMTGDIVELRAGLLPSTGPVVPGGFDFARFFYFRDIGAVGYGLPPVSVLEHPDQHSFWQWVTETRRTLSDHIRDTVGMPEGAVAAALMTGDRAAIPADISDAMRQTNLSHILAISGMHMALVTGMVFFVVRYALLWIPRFAQSRHNKKIAALAALGMGTIYLLLSGFPLSAVRAFIMVAFLFSATLLDREVTPMRSLAFAAIVMLLYDPSNVLEPGFQLSFMATMALIAFYESARFWWQDHLAERHFIARLPAYLGAVIITTLVAELATTPLILYHFNLMSFYGILANVLVMPLVSFIIMPGIVVSYLLLPFGLDFLSLYIVGQGIYAMVALATWVNDIPYSNLLLPSIPWWGMVIAALGMFWLCLWQQRVRYIGVLMILLGVMSMLWQDMPDMIISDDAKHIALRCDDEKLYIAKGRNDSFVAEQWANQAGLEKLPYVKEYNVTSQTNEVRVGTPYTSRPQDSVSTSGSSNRNRTLSGCYRCDVMGCVYRYHDYIIAIPQDVTAIGADCTMANGLVASFYVNDWRCQALDWRIDRDILQKTGAQWINFEKDDIKISNTASHQGNRPWNRFFRK